MSTDTATKTETVYQVILKGNGNTPNTVNMEVNEFRAFSDQEAIEQVKRQYLENHRSDWCYAYKSITLTKQIRETKVLSREEIQVDQG